MRTHLLPAVPTRTVAAILVILWSVILASSLAAAPNRHVVLISIDGLAAFHLENQGILLPNIRELIETGTWAEYSVTVFPSVTHPSHTSLITGVTPRRHGVVNNRVRNRVTGESYHITNKPRSESIRVKTLFDLARKAGLGTASFFWPETRQDPAIDFNVPEVFNESNLGDLNAVTPQVLEELEQAGIPIGLYFEWYGEDHLRPAGDVILSRSAAHVLEQRRPHLLALHILATDVMQHNYGAEHYLSRNALSVADHCVGLIREAARQAGLLANTTFIVTGDHGFATVPYDLNLGSLFAPLGDRVKVFPQGWALFIEKQPRFDESRDGPVLKSILDKLSMVDGVLRVVESSRFPDLGLPTFEESPLIPGQYLVLAEIDTHFRLGPDDSTLLERVPKPSPYHGHGFLPNHPKMWVGFVAAGSGIRSGLRTGPIRQIDVAPTIAFLLDLEREGMEGRVLEEILATPPDAAPAAGGKP